MDHQAIQVEMGKLGHPAREVRPAVPALQARWVLWAQLEIGESQEPQEAQDREEMLGLKEHQGQRVHQVNLDLVENREPKVQQANLASPGP
jgi:hypothetical protein